jgi:hypothetical protein
MKKTILLTLFLCGLLTIPLMATTYRVNNKVADNASLKIYSTLAKAQDAASNGDTIMLEGSQDNYSDVFQCTKQLIIKGPGYFLDENPGISANKLSANVNSINFTQGSKGTVLVGVSLGYAYSFTGGDDITFRRCRINTFLAQHNCENIAFSECYFPEGSTYTYAINSNSGIIITNLVIMNCIFNDKINIIDGSTGVFLNNVFNTAYIIIPTGFDMKNNILFTTDKTNVQLPALPDLDICNNISLADHFGTANNNKANVTASSLFLGASTASTDGTWQLKAGSPAIGAGVGGIDCGAFGGLGPYILSGVPTGPVIYQLNVSSHSTSGNKLPVTIKVKSY